MSELMQFAGGHEPCDLVYNFQMSAV